jgi:hypothetical protein
MSNIFNLVGTGSRRPWGSPAVLGGGVPVVLGHLLCERVISSLIVTMEDAAIRAAACPPSSHGQSPGPVSPPRVPVALSPGHVRPERLSCRAGRSANAATIAKPEGADQSFPPLIPEATAPCG